MFEDWTNCQVCEYNQTGDKCELFGRVIGMHGCSSGIERKPRNHFEMVKAMSMEEMAVWLAAIGPVPEAMLKFWRKWLKEEIEDA